MKVFNKFSLLHLLSLLYCPKYLKAPTFNNELAQPFSSKHYQDIIINNKIVSKGIRSCLPTWKLIEPIVAKYSRAITTLDLGAAHGYFSIQIASKYNSTCVMIEDGIRYSQHVNELLTICKKGLLFSLI